MMEGAQAVDLGPVIEQGLSDLAAALSAERHAQIFMQRYGLIDGRSHTLEEIAAVHQISRERVRQLLAKVHQRIRYTLTRARTAASTRPCVVLADTLDALIVPDGQHWDVNRAADIAIHYLGHLSFFASAQLLLGFLPLEKDRLAPLQQAIHRALLRAQTVTNDPEASERRLMQFLRDVRFPGGVTPYVSEDLGPLLQARSPRSAEGFYSAKLRRHVGFDSRLEWQVLTALDRFPEVRVYQEQPLAIPYTHAGRARLYIPDVLVHLTTGQVVLIEIKPVAFMGASVNLSKWAAMKALCAERGYGLLITDGQTTLLDVLRRAGETNVLEERLLSLIATCGEVDFETFRREMGVPLPQGVALTAAIIRRRLPFQVYPFRLGTLET